MAIEFSTISQIQERLTNALILALNSGQLDLSKQIDPNIRNSFANNITINIILKLFFNKFIDISFSTYQNTIKI